MKAYQIAVEGMKLKAGDGAGEDDTESITDWINMTLIVIYITPVLASTFKLQVNRRWRQIPVVYGIDNGEVVGGVGGFSKCYIWKEKKKVGV